jgi:zinc and cadmium transporter
VNTDSAFLWSVTLLFAVAGSVGGLLVAAAFLMAGRSLHTRLVPWLVSYAVGTLLGAALLVLVPESLDALRPPVALGTLLAGILTFFVLEKLVLWRHSHGDDDPHVHHSTAALVILGDAVHTFVDGVVIAAATLTSIPLGASTALAVIAHEIPQEAGDFGVLLAAGYTRRRALVLNVTSALGGLAGASLMLTFGASAPTVVPFVLAFAAGTFMYVAMADLIPSLHRGHLDTNAFRQVALIAAGIATIAYIQ